jgi:hypothetical protein
LHRTGSLCGQLFFLMGEGHGDLFARYAADLSL